MATTTLVLAATLALGIGLLLGLLGGGGAILTLPLLVYVLGVEPKNAIAMSLFVVGATSLVGSAVHARAGRVRFRVGATFGAAAMIGAFAGGRLAGLVPGSVLLVAFALVMLLTAAAMLRRRPPANDAPAPPPSLARLLLLGAAVGSVSGLVGAGGGFLIVPALAVLGGLAMREAVGTSLFVIALQSFAGFAGHVGHVALDMHLVLVVTAAATLGTVAGSLFTKKVPADALRRGFAWLVLAMGLFVLGKQLLPLASGWLSATSSSLRALAGGALIGLAAATFLFTHGRVAGISGLFGGMLRRGADARGSRVAFVAGILASGAVLRLVYPGAFDAAPSSSVALLLAAGLLVGFGTQLGNGCTSGHGVCGLGRFSIRSLVATSTFMFAGFATVFVARHLLGSAP